MRKPTIVLTAFLVLMALTALFVLLADTARAETLVGRFGAVTDIHHSDKADSNTRRHSAGLAKIQAFVQAMDSEPRIDFIIELGDYVDRLDANNGKDPITNLAEVESAFRSFSGATYHVLGNHEFDNLTRAQLLPNLRNGTDADRIDPNNTWFSFDQGGLHCIVLDADYYGYDDPGGSVEPFDMNGPQNWTNAYIPEAQKQWLIADLAASSSPTVLFTHQTMHRDDTQDHNIKNASEIRGILEADGDVLAVFSGHDHQGDHAEIGGIHYFVLQGNVGISDSIPWDTISPVTGGYDTVSDNQYSVIEVFDLGGDVYNLRINGFGHQDSYNVVIPEPATLSLLTVNSGTGSGTYVPGMIVNIDAEAAPSGHWFDQWIGDTGGIANVYGASTTLTMPAANQEITATYGQCWAGDISQDRLVSGPDLDIILAEWGNQGAEIVNPLADISGDDLVSGPDLDVVLAQWGNSGLRP